MANRINDIILATPPGLESEMRPFVDALRTAAQEVKGRYHNFRWQPNMIEAHRDLFRHLDLVKERLME